MKALDMFARTVIRRKAQTRVRDFIVHNSTWRDYEEYDDNVAGCIEGAEDTAERRIREGASVINVRNLHIHVDNEELAKKLSALSPKLFQSVMLSFFKDLDDDEIADQIGVKEGTVRSYRSRAMEKLQERENGEEENE